MARRGPVAWAVRVGLVRLTRNLCADSAAFPASFDANAGGHLHDIGCVFKTSLPLLLVDQSSPQAPEVAAQCDVKLVRISMCYQNTFDGFWQSLKTFQIGLHAVSQCHKLLQYYVTVAGDEIPLSYISWKFIRGRRSSMGSYSWKSVAPAATDSTDC